MPPNPERAGVVRAYIGLGANLGDARATLASALEALAALPATRPVAQSAHYRSAPVDATGPDYINAVAVLDTAMAPEALLTALLGIEARHGRVRSAPNAPRTLDLDLLAYGDEVRQSPTLVVPHPRLHLRAFALLPLLEVAPQLRLPGLGELEAWRTSVSGQRIERLA